MENSTTAGYYLNNHNNTADSGSTCSPVCQFHEPFGETVDCAHLKTNCFFTFKKDRSRSRTFVHFVSSAAFAQRVPYTHSGRSGPASPNSLHDNDEWDRTVSSRK
eukprot:scpid15104/ scgid19348/ 